MVYCAAVDCKNDSRRTTGIHYHRFPSDESFRKQWLAKVSRADLVVTKDSRLCSEHFTPDCYKRDLKAELLGEKPKFILKPDAVPSLFSHRPPAKKPRLSCEQRTKDKARKEVRFLTYTILVLSELLNTEGLVTPELLCTFRANPDNEKMYEFIFLNV